MVERTLHLLVNMHISLLVDFENLSPHLPPITALDLGRLISPHSVLSHTLVVIRKGHLIAPTLLISTRALREDLDLDPRPLYPRGEYTTHRNDLVLGLNHLLTADVLDPDQSRHHTTDEHPEGLVLDQIHLPITDEILSLVVETISSRGILETERGMWESGLLVRKRQVITE